MRRSKSLLWELQSKKVPPKQLSAELPKILVTPPSNEITKRQIDDALPKLRKGDHAKRHTPIPTPSQPFSPKVPRDNFVQKSEKSRCCNIL